MAFRQMEPVLRGKNPRPTVTARVVVGARSFRRLVLGFNQAAFDAYARGCERFDVAVGEDEDFGTLLLSLRDEGGFSLGGHALRGKRCALACPSGFPEFTTDKRRCEISEAAGHVLVTLPLAGWTAAPAREPKQRPLAPMTRRTISNEGPVDAVDYLFGRGVAARRVAGGRITIDGEVRAFAAVVRLVNAHRTEEGLQPLDPEEVR